MVILWQKFNVLNFLSAKFEYPEAEGLKLAGSGSQYSKNVSLQTAEYPFTNIMDNQDAIDIHNLCEIETDLLNELSMK